MSKKIYPTPFVGECDIKISQYGAKHLINTETMTQRGSANKIRKMEGYLRMPLSLFEMADKIKSIPSPKRSFFQCIVSISGLTPNTVKMILCHTPSAFYPNEDICRQIAKSLKIDVGKLFPLNRLQSGSIADLYFHISSKGTEYHKFIVLLSEATHSKPKTVKKWLKSRRVPTRAAQYAIAQAIGVSISQLFPQEVGNKNTLI